MIYIRVHVVSSMLYFRDSHGYTNSADLHTLNMISYESTGTIHNCMDPFSWRFKLCLYVPDVLSRCCMSNEMLDLTTYLIICSDP